MSKRRQPPNFVTWKTGGRKSVIAVAGNEPFVELRHYPPGDVRDPATHAQYFVRANRRNREAARIHCFARASGIPKAAQREAPRRPRPATDDDAYPRCLPRPRRPASRALYRKQADDGRRQLPCR